ncbi:unnamed protein product [Calicophoron daubneyi]|uniref:SNF-related serine/threonine-protein kinase n=1 Tax=Calicophoron daubneyi TaxID=300641 RepID=A0AAV2TA42_CALDB
MALANSAFFYTPDNDTKIAGLYDLQQTIGRGHYAVVKLARHVFTGEKVAVKVIDKTKLDDIAQDHLFQEVVCMKLVQHPNVVRLYEVIDTPTKLYLILELGDGGDLYDYIMKNGHGLSEKEAKRYFRQIVTAIAYCHKLHVVHRDLKPENVVFFEKLGLVKLTDFGFSNRFTPGTNLDTACGSLAYSAPEILLGDPYDAPKVDIWSLGVILYMLVCGRLPFQEANDSETLTKIMDCEYSIPTYVPPDCAMLISRLLVRDPEKRASLDDILQAEWLRIDDNDLPIEMFSVPLVSRECLSYEDHVEILTKMADGQLATVEEIQSTLDRNEYNHIAATYYLLAERKLKRKFIEQYKVLLQQEQLLEKQKQDQQQPDKIRGLPINNVMQSSIPSAPSNTSRLLGSLGQTTNPLTATAEERVRRFSMILEDEEEEEEEENKPPAAQSPFSRYLAEEYGNIVSSENNANLPEMDETTDEALLEEEEERVAVASLACVRSDLLADQLSGGILSSTGLEHLTNGLAPASSTRPCSRTSGSGVDASDGAESDASLSNWSASGASYTGSGLQSSSASRSLPPTEVRRRSHYRRGNLHHRPLITVKSSPQLLKHITEEEWSGVDQTPGLNRNEVVYESNRAPTDFSRLSSYRHSKNAYSYEKDGTHSLRTSSFYSRQRPMAIDDQLVGLRSRLSFGAHRPPSSTHSPTRTRRFFTSSKPASRPNSIDSWSAAFNMSMLSEFRRRSVCSSPVDNLVAGMPTQKRTAHTLVHQPQSFVASSQTQQQLIDRRCSGPPGLMLAIANLYHFGNTAPGPSRSGSDGSFSENQEITGNIHFSDGPSHEGNDTRSMRLVNSSIGFAPSSTAVENLPTVQEWNGDSPCDVEPSSLTENSTPTHAGTFNFTKHASNKSPHRTLSESRKAASWCSSAPMLSDMDQTQAVSLWVAGNSNPLHTPSNLVMNTFTPTATALREFCTPIREEEDEGSRSGELLAKSALNSGFSRRRRSESSGVRTSSALLTSSVLSRAAFATLADSESVSMISQRPNYAGTGGISYACSERLGATSGVAPGGGGLSSQFTTSNFSLSSLATSLRDSRHMLDVIRGTFELQCHYQRKNAGFTMGGGSSGYPSGRASASTSVRSLTAISESFPITTGLTADFPGHNSRRMGGLYRAGISPDSSVSRPHVPHRRVFSPRRSTTLAPNGQINSNLYFASTKRCNSDRLSMPLDMPGGYELDHSQTSAPTSIATHNSVTVAPLNKSSTGSVNLPETSDVIDTSTLRSNGSCRSASVSLSKTVCSNPSKKSVSNVVTSSPNEKRIVFPTSTNTDSCKTLNASCNLFSGKRQNSVVINPLANLAGFDEDGDLNLVNVADYQSWRYLEDRNGDSSHSSNSSNNNNINNNNHSGNSNNNNCDADSEHVQNKCNAARIKSQKQPGKSGHRQVSPLFSGRNNGKLACCSIS